VLESVAVDNGWIIKAKEIASDHVHLMVEYDHKAPIHALVKAFKGRSSRGLRDEFPELKKLPSLGLGAISMTRQGRSEPPK